MISLFVYRWDYILTTLSVTKGWFWKILKIAFLIVQGMLISYVSFSTVSDIIWEHYNNVEIKNNSVNVEECEVSRFFRDSVRGRNDGVNRHKIEFKFKGENEKIIVDGRTIEKYIKENPKDYILVLSLRKGLHETFVIDSWTLKRVS